MVAEGGLAFWSFSWGINNLMMRMLGGNGVQGWMADCVGTRNVDQGAILTSDARYC